MSPQTIRKMPQNLTLEGVWAVVQDMAMRLEAIEKQKYDETTKYTTPILQNPRNIAEAQEMAQALVEKRKNHPNSLPRYFDGKALTSFGNTSNEWVNYQRNIRDEWGC